MPLFSLKIQNVSKEPSFMVKRKAGQRIPFLRMPSGFVDFSAALSVDPSIVDILPCLGTLGELKTK
jgi:hypothetical protein